MKGEQAQVCLQRTEQTSLAWLCISVNLSADLARALHNSVFWGSKTEAGNVTLPDEADHDHLAAMSSQFMKDIIL